jgi:hypothetical protein
MSLERLAMVSRVLFDQRILDLKREVVEKDALIRVYQEESNGVIVICCVWFELL